MDKQEFLTKIHQYENYSIKFIYEPDGALNRACVRRILFQEENTNRLETGRFIYFKNQDYAECFTQIKHFIDKEEAFRNPSDRIVVFTNRDYGTSVFRFDTSENIVSSTQSIFELLEKMICTDLRVAKPENLIPDISVVPECLLREANRMVESYKSSLDYYEKVEAALESYRMAKEGKTMSKLQFIFGREFEEILYDSSRDNIIIDITYFEK